jgi:hypothetical protein
MRPLADRFWEKVNKSSACWLWIGATTEFGYGVMWSDGSNVVAHRVSWQLHHGPVPVGMQVCHRCDVPQCVNPHHLFLGTQRDNMLDRETKGRGMRARRWDNRAAKGERHGFVKLSTSQVIAIREQSSRLSHSTLAHNYGVCRQTVTDIVSRRTWRHV